MALPERKRLFQIITEEGDNYFVVAETFAEAHQKFRAWDNPTNEDQNDTVNTITDAGYLVDPEFLKLPSGIYEKVS